MYKSISILMFILFPNYLFGFTVEKAFVIEKAKIEKVKQNPYKIAYNKAIKENKNLIIWVGYNNDGKIEELSSTINLYLNSFDGSSKKRQIHASPDGKGELLQIKELNYQNQLNLVPIQLNYQVPTQLNYQNQNC